MKYCAEMDCVKHVLWLLVIVWDGHCVMMETWGSLVTSWQCCLYAPHDEKKSVLIFALIILVKPSFLCPWKVPAVSIKLASSGLPPNCWFYFVSVALSNLIIKNNNVFFLSQFRCNLWRLCAALNWDIWNWELWSAGRSQDGAVSRPWFVRLGY